MAIKLRQGTISDAPVIARFIIEAMSEECCAHFYGPNYNINDFHAFMTSLAGQELTQYCYKNTIVAQSDNDIAGIAVSYNSGKHLSKACTTHFTAISEGASMMKHKLASSISILWP